VKLAREKLERRRLRAARLLAKGLSEAEVARRVGVHRQNGLKGGFVSPAGPTKENGRNEGHQRFLKSVTLGAGALALAADSAYGKQGAVRKTAARDAHSAWTGASKTSDCGK
jgi:hypothetical protein